MNDMTRKWPALTAIVLACAGCTLSAPKTETAITPPPQWRYAAHAEAEARTEQDGRDVTGAAWWRRFDSAELDRLVAQASADSFDIAAAIARVQQAQANSRVAGAALLPNLSVAANGSRQGGFVTDTNVEGTSFDLGLVASYEFDFWGRNRATRDAAIDQLHASEFDRDTVRLTVTADVADTWLQTVGLRERLTIARENARSASDILTLIDHQAQAGAATTLAVAQQRGLLAAQRRSVAQLAQQANDTEATLATLLGMAPGALVLRTDALQDITIPTIGAGLPSALLVHRPDLARAEAQLQAANANIVVARAAMLPNLTLTANAGFGSDHILSLFNSGLYSVAGALTAPIFNAGSLAAQRDLAVSQKSELLATYRQAIIGAFADVERALNAIDGVEAQQREQDEALRQAERALQLAESRYRAGAETMLVVLTAQQTLYTARDEAVQLRQARLQAAVSLFRALGGGWQQADKVSASQPAPSS
jgi:NodT family efflux transporter outer membrane factor (OMF) lipoprotein